MGAQRTPSKPPRDEPYHMCPVLGIRFAESDGSWQKGKLVHPLAVDEPGRREKLLPGSPLPLAPLREPIISDV